MGKVDYDKIIKDYAENDICSAVGTECSSGNCPLEKFCSDYSRGLELDIEEAVKYTETKKETKNDH